MTKRMNISYLLERVMYYECRDGAPTVKELARATDTHERTVYNYISGDRVPPVDWLVAASRYLVSSCGDTRLAEAMLPDGCTISRAEPDDTNGRIDDEIREIVETLGAVSQADARGELHIGRESADKLIRAAMKLREEFKKRMQ